VSILIIFVLKNTTKTLGFVGGLLENKENE